ncbi:MAG: LacI family DNA-binding transcriptional regulator [Candidatus Dormibacteraeota bacterium]|nr:LacI family DNA-binding transcriptional regulator [Candidatus Dormibacteraeota bacterium]
MDGHRRESARSTGRTPTIADVAQRAAVSSATVSRALSGSRPMDAALKERVLAAARELGYLPNPHARALARSQDSSIGVVVHDLSDPYFAEIVRGMLGTPQAAERMLLICDTRRDPELEIAYVTHFRALRAQAIVLAASGSEDRAYTARMAGEVLAFERAGGRVAFIGRHHIPGDSVLPDNVGGARALAKKLVELGHVRIGVISGPRHLTTTTDRLEGFRAGLSDGGITLPAERLAQGDFGRGGGAEGARELLRRDPDLTAIWAMNDVMAVGALTALAEDGIDVPGRITLCGFDDVPLAADVAPRLTTVRVPMAAMGELAVQMALRPGDEDIRTEQVPSEVVVRESSAPARRRGDRR